MSHGRRSIPRPATQSRTRPPVLTLFLFRTRQPPPPARSGDPDFFSGRRGVPRGTGSPTPSPNRPREAEPQVRRSEDGVSGVPGALPSRRLRQRSPWFEGVGVSHSFIHPGRRSFTNICSVPGPGLGAGMRRGPHLAPVCTLWAPQSFGRPA